MISELSISLAIEVATAIDGHISKMTRETWLSIEEFKKRNMQICCIWTYDEAVDISLEER